jgi:GT2 family glycosyltransferase
MAQPTVSIIVLNYNSRDDTLACLRSLEHLTYLYVEVIVVDNGSTDGTVEAVREQFPDVTLMPTGANLGFTGGNNVAIRYALNKGADYIMLLNNDTIVAPDMIDRMLNALERDPSLGVVGPLIYYYDQPEVVWSAGGSIDWQRGMTRMAGIGEEDKGQFGENARAVDFVSGCALLARRAVWERVGLLDDQFFMYYEEIEWCVRVNRAGFKIAHVPTAMIWHKISIEARAASPHTFYYMTRNRLLFLGRTGAGLRAQLVTLIEYAHTFTSWTLRPKWRNRRHLRAIMWRAIRDYSTGKFGPMTV